MCAYQRKRVDEAERVVEVRVGYARVDPQRSERRRKEEGDQKHAEEKHGAPHVYRQREARHESSSQGVVSMRTNVHCTVEVVREERQ